MTIGAAEGRGLQLSSSLLRAHVSISLWTGYTRDRSLTDVLMSNCPPHSFDDEEAVVC